MAIQLADAPGAFRVRDERSVDPHACIVLRLVLPEAYNVTFRRTIPQMSSVLIAPMSSSWLFIFKQHLVNSQAASDSSDESSDLQNQLSTDL